jgi:uncharacterized UBP type Zn finger protein
VVHWSSLSDAGLSNNGSSCYINAVLQFFYNHAQFRQRMMDPKMADLPLLPMGGLPLLTILHLTFVQMGSSVHGDVVDTRELFEYCTFDPKDPINDPKSPLYDEDKGRLFQMGVEQDAEEFTTWFLNHIFAKLRDAGLTFGEDIFGGILHECNCCSGCGRKYITHTPNLVFHLPILPGTPDKPKTVQELFDDACGVKPTEKQKREVCDCESSGTTQMTLKKSRRRPTTLILALNRFAYDEKGVVTKIRSPVTNNLHLKFDGRTLALRGVLVHEGNTPARGHKVFYGLADDRKWICRSDEENSFEVHADIVMRQEGYILMFCEVTTTATILTENVAGGSPGSIRPPPVSPFSGLTAVTRNDEVQYIAGSYKSPGK